jgi:hypothetical protein
MKLDIRSDSLRTAMVANVVDADTFEEMVDAFSATERWLADHPSDFVIERLQVQLLSQMRRSRPVDLTFA